MWVNGRYVSFILGSTSISALEHSRYCLNISSFLIVRNERSKESIYAVGDPQLGRTSLLRMTESLVQEVISWDG